MYNHKSYRFCSKLKAAKLYPRGYQRRELIVKIVTDETIVGYRVRLKRIMKQLSILRAEYIDPSQLSFPKDRSDIRSQNIGSDALEELYSQFVDGLESN